MVTAARVAATTRPVLLLLAAVVLGGCASNSTRRDAAGAGGTAAAASAASTAGAPVAGIDPAGAPFVGSRRSRRYYPATCHTVSLIRAGDRVGFASMKDAEAAGFSKDLYSTDCRY